MNATRASIPWACALALALAACGGDEPAAGPTPPTPTAASGETSPATASTSPAERGSNRPPTIERISIEPHEPAAGEEVRAVVQASDPDGDDVHFRYTWQIKGRRAGADEPRLLLLGASKHDEVELVAVPSDGRDEGPPARATVRVRNRAPDLEAVHFEPRGPVPGGQRIAVRPQARDVDGDRIRFEYRWTVNGERADERGDVFDTAGLKRGDAITVTVIATDGDGSSDPIRTPEIHIANGSPHITSQPTEPSGDGLFTYRVKAEDPDGDRLRFSLDAPPPGMQIDAVTGEILWRPAPDLSGAFPVRIRVEDMQGGEDRQEFQVTLGGEEPEGSPAAPGS